MLNLVPSLPHTSRGRVDGLGTGVGDLRLLSQASDIFENGDYFVVFEKIRVHTWRIRTVFARPH